MNNTFKKNDLPITDFEKIGISKSELEKRPEDLKALLKGDLTTGFSINKFKDLDIEVRLKLEKLESNNTKLIVFPDKMEIKQERKTALEAVKTNNKAKTKDRGYSRTASR